MINQWKATDYARCLNSLKRNITKLCMSTSSDGYGLR